MALESARSAATTSRLSELRETRRETEQAERRLATRKRANSIEEDAVAFIASKQLLDRASDLEGRVDRIGQGSSSVQAAQVGADAIDKFTDQLKAIKAQADVTTDTAELQRLADQFNEISRQIDNVAEDTSFQGRNLIGANSNDETVQTDTNSSVTIESRDLTSTGLGIPQNVTAADLADETFRANVEQTLDDAQAQIRSAQAEQGLQQATLDVREDFARGQANIAEEGAAKLNEAELNAEGARALAGQTRSLIGINSLSLSAQFERSILRLFDN